MKVNTASILANALIEKDKNQVTPIMDIDELYSYARVIGKKMDMPVSITGIDILEIRSDHCTHIKMIPETMRFTIADRTTSDDLIVRYRNNCSYKFIQAVKSKEAYDALGINPELVKAESRQTKNKQMTFIKSVKRK